MYSVFIASQQSPTEFVCQHSQLANVRLLTVNRAANWFLCDVMRKKPLHFLKITLSCMDSAIEWCMHVTAGCARAGVAANNGLIEDLMRLA